MKNKKSISLSPSWYFLLIILLTYITLLFININLFYSSLSFFGNILIKILPIFLLVFILMTISNYYITPEFIIKHTKGKGIKKWIFIVVGGILSSGPIYMWYPLLADLKNKGLSQGYIATFLYNRAIKIPLLPLAILYFGLKYIIVLTIVMIFVSILQGAIINNTMEVKK